jgi:hypothetical protein
LSLSSISSSELVKPDLFFLTAVKFTSDFFTPLDVNPGLSKFVLGKSFFLVTVLFDVTSVTSDTTDSLITGFTDFLTAGLVVDLIVDLTVGLVPCVTSLFVFRLLTLDSVLVSTTTDCLGGFGATLTSFSVALVSTSSAELRLRRLDTNFLTGLTVLVSLSKSGNTSSFCSSMTGGTSLERDLNRLLPVVTSTLFLPLDLRGCGKSIVIFSGAFSSLRLVPAGIFLPVRERDGNSTVSAAPITDGPLVLASAPVLSARLLDPLCTGLLGAGVAVLCSSGFLVALLLERALEATVGLGAAPPWLLDLPLLLLVVLDVIGVVVSGWLRLISLSILEISPEVNSDADDSKLVETVDDDGSDEEVVSTTPVSTLFNASSRLSVVADWNKALEDGALWASNLFSVSTLDFPDFLNGSMGVSSTTSSTS